MAVAIRQRWLLAGVAVAVVAAVALAVARAARSPASDHAAAAPLPLEFAAGDLVRPQSRPLVVELTLPGTVQAVSQVTVHSKLSAVVERVEVREGDRVRAGQRVAQFDTAALRAQLAERSASLAAARAQLAQTDRTRQANAQLVRRNFIAQSAFDSADAAYQTQLANVAVTEAQVAQTQLQLDDADVRAPIAGQVSRRYAQPGEKLAYDAPLLSIVDLSQLEVQAQAAVSDIARVVPGAALDIEIEGLPQRRFRARVDRINPSADPGSRTISVYCSLPNDGALLRAGMFARAHLRVAAERPLPSLPLAAIREDAGQTVVWVLADGRLARRVVSVGRRDERAQAIEILGGVDAGDLVLASRFDELKDGREARIVERVDAAAR